MLLSCGVGEDSWEFLGLQWDPTSPSSRKSALTINWKDWCWSLSSNTLVNWCEKLTHWKDPDAGKDWRQEEKGMTEKWDGWMASPSQWTCLWAGSGSWWWTGRPGMLQSMGLQRVGHDWVTEPMSFWYVPTSLLLSWGHFLAFWGSWKFYLLSRMF